MKQSVKKKTINPFNKKELKALSKTWKLKLSQLKDLMGVTGSARLDVLENHLRKTGLWQL